MKELVEANEKLKMINEYLVNSIKKKEDIYLALSKELNQTKSHLAQIKIKREI